MRVQTAEHRTRRRFARQRDTASLAARRVLMAQLVCLIRGRGLNQTQAARWLAVDQSRISDLLNDKLGRLSTDTLLDMVARAGVSVTISFGNTEIHQHDSAFTEADQVSFACTPSETR